MSGARIALDAVFIANRGDAALRVIRTARRLGLVTAVACTRAELARSTAAVDAADYAVLLDGAEDAHGVSGGEASTGVSAPYVDEKRVLTAAERFRETLVETRTFGPHLLSSLRIAVHPGWGFLSERADFAQAVLERGFRWCGPSPEAMQVMGEKASARETMANARVPTVPGLGLDEIEQSNRHERGLEETLAIRVGYPLILKPVYGGGGKGMRVVRQPTELARALQAARREARIACGNDTLLVERYLEQVRHIEFQVFGGYHDGDYRAVHLYERDCSVQRRHQKIVEESPAPGLPQETREKMAQCAVRAAEAVRYEGAGTVEFLYDADRDDFFFMEMNTRLQVEHPVTEMIVRQRHLDATKQEHAQASGMNARIRTGARTVDLVEWQLRVAAGEALPVATQNDLFNLTPAHAMELRLYAEAPDEQGNWLPQHGLIDRFEINGVDVGAHTPTDTLRIDSGVRTGDQVLMEFDPMLAKLTVCKADRQQTIEELDRLLETTKIWGIATNVPFLRTLLADEEFIQGWDGRGRGVPVTWLEQRLPLLLSVSKMPSLSAATSVHVSSSRHPDRSDALERTATEAVTDSQSSTQRSSEKLESRLAHQEAARVTGAVSATQPDLEQPWRALAAAAWAVSEPSWSMARPFYGFQNDGQGNHLEWFVEYPVPQDPERRPAAEVASALFYRVLLRQTRQHLVSQNDDNDQMDDHGWSEWRAEIQQVWPPHASTAAVEPALVHLTQYPDDRLAVDGVAATDPLCFVVPADERCLDDHQMQWLVRLEQGALARVHSPLSYALWRLGRVTRASGDETDRLAKRAEHVPATQPGQVMSPMPGRLLEMLVRKGERVDRGDPLATLEAMKMEHTIRATTTGMVVEVADIRPGSYVPAGALLLTIENAQTVSDSADKGSQP